MRRCEGWSNFKKNVAETGWPIVCFGAGMLGWYIEHLFVKEKIWNRIECFLDNNEQKEGTYVGEIESKPVMTLETFKKKCPPKFIMLITCVTFVPILQQLENEKEWEDICCYIYPELNYDIVFETGKFEILIQSKVKYIPKIIHYCWFGRNEKDELHKRCIESWRKKCPDYEIVEWNEDNYDIAKNTYMSQAYERKKWAYVTDYARLDILWNYGGIYLDTDVELLKGLDILLGQKAFIAYGEWPTVNSGAGIGSIKGHPLIKEMRDNPRGRTHFLKSDGSCDMTQNCVYEARILRGYGFMHDFRMQYVQDMLILPPRYIATSSIIGKNKYVTEETIAIHHNGESWADKKRIEERKQTLKDYCID